MAGDGQLTLLIVGHQIVHAGHIKFRIVFHRGKMIANAAAKPANHYAAHAII